MPSSDTPYCLSTWDQSASRVHVRLAICFAMKPEWKRDQVAGQLRNTLHLLAKSKPQYAGRLFLGPSQGRVYMHEADEYSIPFEVHDESKSFGMTYDQFRQEGFPAYPTVHPRYCLDGDVKNHFGKGEGVPVVIIRAFFVTGGLVLSIFFHHAFGDGNCMGEFVADFANQSRQRTMLKNPEIQNRDMTYTGYADKSMPSFSELLKQCPEYVYDNKLQGPNNSVVGPGGISPDAYKKSGRTFIFDKDQLQKLRNEIRTCLGLAAKDMPGFPSTYVTLAALTWSHTAAARRQGEKNIQPPASGLGDKRDAALLNPVNWALRAFRNTPNSYHGNAVMLARTTIPVPKLLEAAKNTAALAQVTLAIDQAIRLDEEFIKKRLQLVDSCQDPRNIMLSFDARVREDLAFNTWRDFGADCEWDLTGSGGPLVLADALRRPQPDWNLVGSLILPARRESTDYEIVVTIPASSMAVLLADKEFTKWTRRIIG